MLTNLRATTVFVSLEVSCVMVIMTVGTQVMKMIQFVV